MTRTPRRTPNRRVRELVALTEATLIGLPYVHTTDAYRFADVLSSKELHPSDCDVFGERLLYLFLGRPAYRTRRSTNDNLTFDLPVAVILKPDATIPPSKRIYPFDTGAFERGLYSTYFHKESILEDFELTNTSSSPVSYISHFYTSIREYYNGATRKNVDLPFDGFEARGLLELARAIPDPSAPSTLAPDQRSSSVEVQIQSPVKLTGNTLAIVLPQQYLDEPSVSTAIDEIDPTYVKTYDVMKNMGTREIAAIIFHVVRDVYLDAGIF